METSYEKYINKNNYHRLAGILFVLSTLLYLAWLVFHLNTSAPYISYLFLIVQTFNFLLVTLSVVNHWRGSYRTDSIQLPEPLPSIAIIVPTYKEPVPILKETVISLLHVKYSGEVIILVSNDDNRKSTVNKLRRLMEELNIYWWDNLRDSSQSSKKLFLRHSIKHSEAKAGNLNQSVAFLRKYFPNVDLVLTQDADEIVHPEILNKTVGYFSNPNVAFVQTIKQTTATNDDPFGNHDLLWYCRTAACKDFDNAMFACGSGVVWRISAVEPVGGFSTWNLVEDLTTSYNLLSQNWEERYHFEALSKGLAPDDLANVVKQRGTWALDTMRLFFWDNPLTKPGFTFKQRLQFLETPLFYLNGFSTLILMIVTSLSLFLSKWPTTADARTHALYLLPSFIAMEAYFVLLAGNIPISRVRQYWVGFSPIFAFAAVKALWYGPNKKPSYVVTRKENKYGNYLYLVWPQIVFICILFVGLTKTLIGTPLYSEFDWAAVFWGFFQASFFFTIIRVSLWNYIPQIQFTLDVVSFKKLYTPIRAKIERISEMPVGAFIPKFIAFLVFVFWKREK